MDDYRNDSACKEITRISPSEAYFEQVISYNLSEGERPGGLKVRFKVKVATGKQAAALDARQAEAIRGLLSWARQYKAERERLPGSR